MFAAVVQGMCYWFAAHGGCKGEEPIRVTVLTVLADNASTHIDEKLKTLAEEVRKKNPGWTAFRIARTESQELPVGKAIAFVLVGTVTAEVTWHGTRDEEGRAKLTVKPPESDAVTYACSCGKYLPIVTNYKTMKQEQVILAIMAKPCRKD